MSKSLLFVLAFCCLFASAHAADGDDALFGLKWGMSVAEFKTAGVILTKLRGERNLETYKALSVPKPLSDVETYMFVFADGRLVKMSAIGKAIVGDPTGSTGKEKFDTLHKALDEKYGKPTQNYQSIGNKLYKEYDEFYQCLAYSGCGMWVSVFESPDKAIFIELKGSRRGTGQLEVTAESKPQWMNALDVYKSGKASSDKDAL